MMVTTKRQGKEPATNSVTGSSEESASAGTQNSRNELGTRTGLPGVGVEGPSQGESRNQKAWQGRIKGATDPVFEAFNRSLVTDLAMAEWDVFQTRHWAASLAEVGVLRADELDLVQTALDEIDADLIAGVDFFLPSDEDIHMAIERRISERSPSAGGKLQTGRSRNDQVITDLRLTLKDRLDEIEQVLQSLQGALIDRATE